MKKILCVLTVCAVLLTGCTGMNNGKAPADTSSSTSSSSSSSSSAHSEEIESSAPHVEDEGVGETRPTKPQGLPTEDTSSSSSELTGGETLDGVNPFDTGVTVPEVMPEEIELKTQSEVPLVGEISEFIQPNNKDKIPEVGTASKDTMRVGLYLGDTEYVYITLPKGVDFVTDFNKFIYGKNGTFNISVLSNVERKDFAKAVSIHEQQSYDKDTLFSKPNTKGPQEFAKFIEPNKAIVVRVYNVPEVYATIFENVKSIKAADRAGSSFTFPEDYEYAKAIPYDKAIDYKYTYQATPGFNSSRVKTYMCETGSFTMSEHFKKFDDAVQYSQEMAVFITGQTTPDLYFQSDDKMYTQIGEFTVGVVRVNFNTSICLFGIGAPARMNIKMFMTS